MPRKRNVKPDNKMLGKKKKNDICMACVWLLATLENVMPTVRLARIKINAQINSNTTEPETGTLILCVRITDSVCPDNRFMMFLN